ncbi:hypothetical protein ASPVEDRAFT_31294 [Aspergillus versicolor CBS 583.65]|uniref:EF-hand domain-containing protein n=1 Tax=Aspergillus versicolor CBS 583.65 TaxID=1036611 RepID=A0A1L9PTQ6_ASPVE|nr:uncharacterized protein ASPVEDRAFT_31294 [Aspergillus versicolor CBS 583.65]OJJ04863.1 hypothetical protein ASPVEDRAFT_31294 [Aspergillus versicolor CBS 583.65]
MANGSAEMVPWLLPAAEKAHAMPSVAIVIAELTSSRKRDLPFLMERADKIDSLFQSVDDDSSGDLDLGEYIAWVTEHLGRAHPVSPSLYQSYIDHFYSFDTDKNSKLDLGEVQAVK